MMPAGGRRSGRRYSGTPSGGVPARPRGAHGDELLAGGRMDADGGVELGLGGALPSRRSPTTLDQLGGIVAHHVHADAPGRVAASTISFMKVRCSRPDKVYFIGRKRRGVDVAPRRSRAAPRSSVRPTLASCGLAEYGRRHVAMVGLARLAAEHGVGEAVPLHDRHRRQVDAVGDVAHRLDVGHRGLRDHSSTAMAPALSSCTPDLLQAEAVGVGRAAGGVHHAIGSHARCRPVSVRRDAPPTGRSMRTICVSVCILMPLPAHPPAPPCGIPRRSRAARGRGAAPGRLRHRAR